MLPCNEEERTKNEEEEEQGRGIKVKVKDDILIDRLSVVIQSAVTSYIYMRRLDFPYKKMTQIPSKTSKDNLTRTTRAGTSGQPGTSRLKLHQVTLLHSSCRLHTASDRDGPKRKVVDLAM